MSLKEKIQRDAVEATKSGDSIRREVLRMLKSTIQSQEVELRSKKGRDYQLTDDETIQVLGRYAKQRRQSIDSFRKAGREDLAGREERELEIVETYLPDQLSQQEIEELVRAAVAETGAAGPSDLGRVMKKVMPAAGGRADGNQVRQIAVRLLSD